MLDRIWKPSGEMWFPDPSVIINRKPLFDNAAGKKVDKDTYYFL